MRVWGRHLLFYIIHKSGLYYKTPSNLSYLWNFGFFALFFLILQILTGIFLAMFYNPEPLHAFASILYINNENYYGWWVRFFHSNGASFFFAVVYIHMARGLYFGSFNYPRELLWISGVLIWILMIVTAFLGYVLPWGQMSFWGAMVITSLLAAIPYIGYDLILLLWGGFSIESATLHRFFSLHFFLPFLILGLSIVHLCFLHEFGSNNFLGLSSCVDGIVFTPFYSLKDFFSLVFLFFIFFFFLFLFPDFLAHPDNYIYGTFLITPPHIVPEWYFLPMFAVLRSVTSKLFGIVLLFKMILVLFLLPFLTGYNSIRVSFFRPFFTLFYWFFIITCVFLCWIGSLPIMMPYTFLGVLFAIFYFFFFCFCFPFFTFMDAFIYNSYVALYSGKF